MRGVYCEPVLEQDSHGRTRTSSSFWMRSPRRSARNGKSMATSTVPAWTVKLVKATKESKEPAEPPKKAPKAKAKVTPTDAKPLINLQVNTRSIPFQFEWSVFLQKRVESCTVNFYSLSPLTGHWEKVSEGTSSDFSLKDMPNLYELVAHFPPGYVIAAPPRPKCKGKSKGKSKGDDKYDPSKDPFWKSCAHLFK